MIWLVIIVAIGSILFALAVSGVLRDFGIPGV